MRVLKDLEEEAAKRYLILASIVALDSKCLRAKCGSVIIKDGHVIGKGYNAPPQDKILDKCLKDSIPKTFKSDRTCCLHAEQRAVRDALIHNPKDLTGSTIYFVRIKNDNSIEFAGKPFCTICSKEVLDNNIAYFVLWHEDGITEYNTTEYNELSFQYRE